MNLKTIFSADRKYRYTLWRQWWKSEMFIDKNKMPRFVQFIGLNPSTADETHNDPTVTRCINYAMAWGYDAMCMTNLFAFRATDPDVMMECDLPVGEATFCGYELKGARPGLDVSFSQRNDAELNAVANAAGLIVAAWGNGGLHLGRSIEVMELIRKAGRPVHCLGVTKQDQPKHPLYLKKDLKPIPFA